MPSTCDITREDAEKLIGSAERPEWTDQQLADILEILYGGNRRYNFCVVEEYNPKWVVNYPDVIHELKNIYDMNQTRCDTCGKVITGKVYKTEIDDSTITECVKCHSSNLDNEPDEDIDDENDKLEVNEDW